MPQQRLALTALLATALIAAIAAPKSKWKESDDPNRVTHWSGRHDTYSIHEAAKQGHTEEVLRHIRKDRNAVHQRDRDGQTALHYAALYDQTHLIEVLHEHGADIEATNKHEMTPIHYTARSNHLEGLKILVDKGANIHHKDKFNATALTHAAQKGHEDPFHHLLHLGADWTHKSWDHVHKVERAVHEWGHHKKRPEIKETLDRFLARSAET